MARCQLKSHFDPEQMDSVMVFSINLNQNDWTYKIHLPQKCLLWLSTPVKLRVLKSCFLCRVLRFILSLLTSGTTCRMSSVTMVQNVWNMMKCNLIEENSWTCWFAFGMRNYPAPECRFVSIKLWKRTQSSLLNFCMRVFRPSSWPAAVMGPHLGRVASVRSTGGSPVRSGCTWRCSGR